MLEIHHRAKQCQNNNDFRCSGNLRNSVTESLPRAPADADARRSTYFGLRSSRVTVWKTPACCSALAISNPASRASRL